MASDGGGGASADAGEEKQLDSNKVSKLFTAVLISDVVRGHKGRGVVLIKNNKTLLGEVAEETAKKLGGTVSKAFGAPSMRYLLRTLGLCRVDFDLPLTDTLLSPNGPCKVDVVLRLATGSNTALWRIIEDYRFVSAHLDTPAWAPLKEVVFTVLEPADQPADQPTTTKKRKKAEPLSEAEERKRIAAEKKRSDRLETLKNLAKQLDAQPELKKVSDVTSVAQAPREEDAEEDEGSEEDETDDESAGPCAANKEGTPTHRLVPDTEGAHSTTLHRLLLSTHMRKEQGGEADLDPTTQLKCGIPPQAYLYMHRLSERLPPANQDAAYEARAKAEQKLFQEHRNLLPEDPVEVVPVQAAQGGGGGGGFASAAPPIAAPLAIFKAHASAARSLNPNTPVVKYMLSEPHRPKELRVCEGVYGLLGVLSDGRLVFVRHFDDFEYLSNDGDVPFSRLGYHTDLPEGFAGSIRLRNTGQRAGRVAVCSEVAEPFEKRPPFEKTPWERKGRRLVFDARGTQLLGLLNTQGQVVPLPGLSEALHAALQDELNMHQVVKARLSDPGWLVDFHHEAIMPLPTEERANTDPVPNASVDMQLDSETETEGGAAERGRDTKRTREEFERAGVVVCNNRLTSGDLASLVMVHYLWSGPRVVQSPQAPNLLAPLPVVWELPKALLTGLLGDKSLAESVYDFLLRPSGDSEVFFLQDLLTLFNGCGWAGRLKQDVDTFIKTRWAPLLSYMPQGALLTLPAARAQSCTPPTGPLAYVTMSTSEPMTLSLHYYGQGGQNEQHARIDYYATATGAKAFIVDLPEDMKGMLTAGRVDPTDLREVVRALRTPATQEVMQEGATKTEKKSSYHYRGKNKEQQGPQTRQRTSSSGSGA